MVDVNDTSGTTRDLENAWSSLHAAAIDPTDTDAHHAFITDREADLGRPLSYHQTRWLTDGHLDPRDYEAITDFIHHREHAEGQKPNTIIHDLGNLRRAGVWMDTPLVDWHMRDVTAFVAFLTSNEDGGRGLDPDDSGIYGYKRTLRLFYTWADQQPRTHTDYLPHDADYSFGPLIELPRQSVRTLTEGEDFPSESEVSLLKKYATGERNPALIDFLADCAGRITLVTQLRVGDVRALDTNDPRYYPNDNGLGQKGVPNKGYAIMASHATLRTYLNRHHVDIRGDRPARPEAPLFPVSEKHYDWDEPSKCALSPDRIRDLLKETVHRANRNGAEISPDAVHPHALRHVAITRLARANIDSREIANIAGWADDRMLKAYDHTTDKEHRQTARQQLGLPTEDETDDVAMPAPTAPVDCPNCTQPVSSDEDFCGTCGSAVSIEARERTRHEHTTTIDPLAELLCEHDDQLSDDDRRDARCRLRVLLGLEGGPGDREVIRQPHLIDERAFDDVNLPRIEAERAYHFRRDLDRGVDPDHSEWAPATFYADHPNGPEAIQDALNSDDFDRLDELLSDADYYARKFGTDPDETSKASVSQ